MSKNIYRLIKPYQSNKVYEASTVMHGAGKCYKELKKANINSDIFSIMDINLNTVYDFNINPKNKMILEKDPNELLNQNGGDELFQIKNEIEQIKNRLTTLEKSSQLKEEFATQNLK
jgi:hypothetical protein